MVQINKVVEVVMEKGRFRVLLFYKYVHVEDPETLVTKHSKACKEIGLKGRIFIGTEGINGTCSGTIEQTDAYIAMMQKDERFKDMYIKSMMPRAMYSRR